MIEILLAVGTGLPWWAACLFVSFTIMVCSCLRALRLLIPDKSGDRLAWWIAVLEHRRRTAGAAARRARANRRYRQPDPQRDDGRSDPT